jgi:hypothetical protein
LKRLIDELIKYKPPTRNGLIESDNKTLLELIEQVKKESATLEKRLTPEQVKQSVVATLKPFLALNDEMEEVKVQEPLPAKKTESKAKQT